MSGPKWTPAQQAAIADRGGALLVSAAAGSGKTAVLTERAVQLITDPEHPVNPDRLLIVTFTNAAAAELRARIGQALLHRSQLQPGDLIFFHDDYYSSSTASHCGIYVGNDQFVHASTYGSGGVLLTALNGNPYYSAHYIAARRMG